MHDMNPYPQDWNSFDDLRRQRESHWEKQLRAERDIFSGNMRGVYFDKGLQTYYTLITSNAAIGESYKRSRDFCRKKRDGFFANAHDRFTQEWDSYQDARALGFLVPDSHSMVVNNTRRSRDWYGRLRQVQDEFVFEAALAASRVDGLPVHAVLMDPAIDEKKKERVASLAITQGLGYGVLRNDYDRISPSNMIVADIAEEKPEKIYHIDFEMAGIVQGKELFRRLVTRVMRIYPHGLQSFDLSHSLSVLQDAKLRLLKENGFSHERKITYLERIEHGMAAMNDMANISQRLSSPSIGGFE